MIAVLVKELRTRMRGWRTPAVLILYLLLLALVCVLVLQTNLNSGSFGGDQAAKLGITVFTWLAYMQLVLLVVITPASTATAISGERQRQTLDLLLITKLPSLGIAVGKLLAAVAFNLLLIVGSLPVFALVFLLGGVSLSQMLQVFAVFFSTVLSFGSIALLVSALSKRAATATLVSYVIALLLTLGLLVLSLYLQAQNLTVGAGHTPLPITAYFDPGYALAAVLPAIDPSSALGFDFHVWQVNVVVSCIVTVLCVAVCAALLRERRA